MCESEAGLAVKNESTSEDFVAYIRFPFPPSLLYLRLFPELSKYLIALGVNQERLVLFVCVSPWVCFWLYEGGAPYG